MGSKIVTDTNFIYSDVFCLPSSNITIYRLFKVFIPLDSNFLINVSFKNYNIQFKHQHLNVY